jgi:hypothetical protein
MTSVSPPTGGQDRISRELTIFKEAAAIADPILDPLDDLLEDQQLVALSTQLLAARSP